MVVLWLGTAPGVAQEGAPPAAAAPKPGRERTAKRPPPRKVRAPEPEPFRYAHFHEERQGHALESIDFRLDGEVLTMEVVYLGQTQRYQGPVDPSLRDAAISTLLFTEVWPHQEGATSGCLELAFGSTSRTASFDVPPDDDPALARFLSTVRMEALELAYLGELSRYGSDDPSLAVGTINMILRDVRAGNVAPGERVIELLVRIAADRTVRPLVRRAGRSALAALGQPLVDEEPNEAQPTPPPTPPTTSPVVEGMAD